MIPTCSTFVWMVGRKDSHFLMILQHFGGFWSRFSCFSCNLIVSRSNRQEISHDHARFRYFCFKIFQINPFLLVSYSILHPYIHHFYMYIYMVKYFKSVCTARKSRFSFLVTVSSCGRHHATEQEFACVQHSITFFW